MTIRSQYRASLKHPQAEELLDLYLYRPVAFVLAKVLVRTPVTPNQITGTALLIGAFAGLCFATGQPSWMVIGAVLYGLENTLDCCDGMVARMKKNGTQFGRMVDVFADVIVGTFTYVGLGIGLTRGVHALPVHPWILVVAAGISYALQCALFDSQRNAFLARVHNSVAAQQQELDDLERQLQRHDPELGGVLRRNFVRIYIRYMRSQQGSSAQSFTGWDDPSQARTDIRIIRLWSLIGSTSHVTVFILAMILNAPMILFTYAIVVANLWALIVWRYSKSARYDGDLIPIAINRTRIVRHRRRRSVHS